MNAYHLTVSVGQELGSGLVGGSQGLPRGCSQAVSRAAGSASRAAPSRGWRVGAGWWLEASAPHRGPLHRAGCVS